MHIKSEINKIYVNFIIKNISMLSSMTMINHYPLIDSSNSYNIYYLSWLIMTRKQLLASSSWLIIK